MSEKPIVSITSIATFFKDSLNMLRGGENSYHSGNVVNVLFDSEVHPALLKGEVKASTQNRCYSIEISLDVEDGIVAASCSCPSGQVICHHMAAVCLFGYYNISVTDKACTSNAPKDQAEDEQVLTIDDIYKNKKYRATNRDLTEAEIQNFLRRLEELEEPCGFVWLLKARGVTAVEDING